MRVDHALGVGDRFGETVLGELRDVAGRRRDERVGRDHMLDQADALGLGGVDPARVQSRSSARPAPTRRGTIQVVPCSATSPRLRKIVVKLAAVDAKRTSHIAASTNPPPAATPFTAAITGFGTSRR